MPAKLRKTVRKEIRDNLLSQLKLKSADLTLYEDMVDDYMRLWDLKELLIEDIAEHGLTKMYGSVMKENPSPKQLPIVNRQMLALLSQLGISADTVNGGGGGYVPL